MSKETKEYGRISKIIVSGYEESGVKQASKITDYFLIPKKLSLSIGEEVFFRKTLASFIINKNPVEAEARRRQNTPQVQEALHRSGCGTLIMPLYRILLHLQNLKDEAALHLLTEAQHIENNAEIPKGYSDLHEIFNFMDGFGIDTTVDSSEDDTEPLSPIQNPPSDKSKDAEISTQRKRSLVILAKLLLPYCDVPVEKMSLQTKQRIENMINNQKRFFTQAK